VPVASEPLLRLRMPVHADRIQVVAVVVVGDNRD
jgi:hypothetical protein